MNLERSTKSEEQLLLGHTPAVKVVLSDFISLALIPGPAAAVMGRGVKRSSSKGTSHMTKHAKDIGFHRNN